MIGVTAQPGMLRQSTPAATGYREMVLADNPDNYWRLGEAVGEGVAVDETGNQNGTYGEYLTPGSPGILADNTAVKSVSGYAAPGVVVTPAGQQLISSDFTVELWVKYDQWGSLGYWGDTPDPASWLVATGGYEWQHWNLWMPSAGVLWFVTGNYGGAAETKSTAAVVLGSWHHIVVTRVGANATIYVNGVDVTDVRGNHTNIAYEAGMNSAIGRHHNRGYVPYASFDEVAFYGHALTPERIVAHYAKANEDQMRLFAPALWLADQDADESQWTDYSGNGRHLTQADPDYQPVIVPDGLNGRQIRECTGKSMSYNGVIPIVDDYTFISVVKCNNQGSTSLILYNGNGGADGCGIMFWSSSVCGLHGGRSFLVDGYPSLSYETICTTRTGGTVTMYRNGIPCSITNSGAGLGSPTGTIQMGPDGDCAEHMVFPRALSAAQLQSAHLYLHDKWGVPVMSFSDDFNRADLYAGDNWTQACFPGFVLTGGSYTSEGSLWQMGTGFFGGAADTGLFLHRPVPAGRFRISVVGGNGYGGLRCYLMFRETLDEGSPMVASITPSEYDNNAGWMHRDTQGGEAYVTTPANPTSINGVRHYLEYDSGTIRLLDSTGAVRDEKEISWTPGFVGIAHTHFNQWYSTQKDDYMEELL